MVTKLKNHHNILDFQAQLYIVFDSILGKHGTL